MTEAYRLRFWPHFLSPRFMPTYSMEFGRLIRASKFRDAPGAIADIVALPEAAKAIELIRTKVANPEDEVEDLGRVSDTL